MINRWCAVTIKNLEVIEGIGRSTVSRVGVVGLGVMGCSWTALLLAHGIDVTGYDPCPNAKKRVSAELETQEPVLRALGFNPRCKGEFSIATSIDAAVASVDFVQENGPENLNAKRSLIAAIDEVTPREIVIASSTSGMMPTELAQGTRTPERILVGHPFLPVTVMPLVEVVGGQSTSPAATTWAAAFYKALGKEPVVVRKEVPGLLANRFQVLVLEEALSLVERGVATVDEVERAFVNGPGMRWSFAGPISLFAHAAGDAGMRTSWDRFLQHRNRVLNSVERVRNEDNVLAEVAQQTLSLREFTEPGATIAERNQEIIKLLSNKNQR